LEAGGLVPSFLPLVYGFLFGDVSEMVFGGGWWWVVGVIHRSPGRFGRLGFRSEERFKPFARRRPADRDTELVVCVKDVCEGLRAVGRVGGVVWRGVVEALRWE
jgi:hypothetical protein